MSLMMADNDDEQAKSDLLLLTFHLLGQFGDLYKAIDGFVELYEPIISILNNLETKKLFDGQKVRNLTA